MWVLPYPKRNILTTKLLCTLNGPLFWNRIRGRTTFSISSRPLISGSVYFSAIMGYYLAVNKHAATMDDDFHSQSTVAKIFLSISYHWQLYGYVPDWTANNKKPTLSSFALKTILRRSLFCFLRIFHLIKLYLGANTHTQIDLLNLFCFEIRTRLLSFRCQMVYHSVSPFQI